MAITTSSGDRYDSLENFIGNSPSEYIKPLKADDPNDIADYDIIADWYKRSPELSVGFAFERAGKIPPTSDLEDVKPSENIVERGQHESPIPGSKEDWYDLGTAIEKFRGEDPNSSLGKAAGVADINNRINESLVRMKNKEMAKKDKIIKLPPPPP